MRKTNTKRKVYKETLEQIRKGYGLTKIEFSRLIGMYDNYYSNRVMQNEYINVAPNRIDNWSRALGVPQDVLTQVPEEKEEPKVRPETTPAENNEDLAELIRDGFRMLHLDIQMLIETMDKYWKPETPKYQVKEREQP